MRVIPILLVAAMVAWSLPAYARDEHGSRADNRQNDLAQGLERCTRKATAEERLGCYDALAGYKGAAQPAAEARSETGPGGKWLLTKSIDPMNDEKTVDIGLPSNEPGMATLHIRCRGGKVEVFIDWAARLAARYVNQRETDSTTVATRIDKEGAEESVWAMSIDRLATFYPQDNVRFGARLVAARKLAAQATNSSLSQVTVTFNLKGVDTAVKPVAEACSWNPSR